METCSASVTSWEAAGVAPLLNAATILRYNLELTFMEAAFGLKTKIKIPRLEPCERLFRQRGRSRSRLDNLSYLSWTRADSISAGFLQHQPYLPPLSGQGNHHQESLQRMPRRRSGPSGTNSGNQDSGGCR